MSRAESGPHASVRPLFLVTAASEVAGGLTLLGAPAVVIRLLFGSAVDVFPATGIVRVTGAAMLSLGAPCWWARHDERSAAARALVGGLLIYNATVVALSILGALGTLGPLQWSAIVLHGGLAIWCARSLPIREG